MTKKRLRATCVGDGLVPGIRQATASGSGSWDVLKFSHLSGGIGADLDRPAPSNVRRACASKQGRMTFGPQGTDVGQHTYLPTWANYLDRVTQAISKRIAMRCGASACIHFTDWLLILSVRLELVRAQSQALRYAVHCIHRVVQYCILHGRGHLNIQIL